MRTPIFLVLLILPFCLAAQNYNVNAIPDSLSKDAVAVMRLEEMKVIVKSPSKAILRHKYAITIMNEEGRRYSGYVALYDKMHSINDIDGTLYDANGKKVKSVKKKDIADLSDDDDANLMTDSRYKQHFFYYSNYPYTVEYEDEVELNTLYSLPSWTPIEAPRFSVQQSRFIVESPNDYQLRYKQTCLDTKPVISRSDKTTSYQWEVANLPALKYEDYQPRWSTVTPHVFVAPSTFDFGGYAGDMSSWQSLGKFGIALYQGRDELPENVKADIHAIADKLSDRNEKIKALYEYLQKNTRYISIQLGIGGLQPFPAKDVAAKKYGDCKALSNFMVSMLKEAGIKGHSVWVKSGDGEIGLYEDFPNDYFNHVIACVPGEQDTTWLECTNQTMSAGFMGSFTGNRKALLLAEDGGHVVSTPVYDKKDNMQLRKIDAVIGDDGLLSVNVYTHFTGQQQELQHGLLHTASADQREKYLNQAISLATYKIEKADYKEQKGKIPAIDEYLKISAPNYATVSGKRLFIEPNMFNKGGKKLSTDEPRRFDISFDYPYVDVDTIHITIPAGYQAEALPKDVSLQSKFGAYSISFKVNGNSIDVLRKSEGNAGVFPASDYGELAKFFEKKYNADRSRIVLIKKEG